jgi:hypothetical protein
MFKNDLIMALDPVYLFRECLQVEPDGWQKQILRFTGKRLIMNCSRQSGKSTTSAVLALYRAMYYPNNMILLISPSLRQSSELFRKVAGMLKTLKQQPKRVEDNKLSLVFANGSRIVSLPSSEATIRGFSGVNLIIEDEASRVDDSLYYSIRPMLAVSDGTLILMSTPWGKRGHFFHEWTEGGSVWERVMITADDCPRITREFLEEEKAALGDWWFSQEYYCEFRDTTDQLFHYDTVMQAFDDQIEPLF